ncbi:hypothetical protein D3C78_1818360 [compost metagenome]
MSNSTASKTLLNEVGTAEETIKAAAVSLSKPNSMTISHAASGPPISLKKAEMDTSNAIVFLITQFMFPS